MLVNDSAAVKRLNSPLNLMNKIRSSSSQSGSDAMSLFTGPRDKSVPPPLPVIPKPIEPSFNPFEINPPETKAVLDLEEQLEVVVKGSSEQKPEPTLDEIMKDNDAKIKLGLAHDSALGLLTASVTKLAEKLDDVKADKLPSVISAASKVVESIRKERIESAKSQKDSEVHFHFYTPQQKHISDYQIIEVNTTPEEVQELASR